MQNEKFSIPAKYAVDGTETRSMGEMRLYILYKALGADVYYEPEKIFLPDLKAYYIPDFLVKTKHRNFYIEYKGGGFNNGRNDEAKCVSLHKILENRAYGYDDSYNKDCRNFDETEDKRYNKEIPYLYIVDSLEFLKDYKILINCEAEKAKGAKELVAFSATYFQGIFDYSGGWFGIDDEGKAEFYEYYQSAYKNGTAIENGSATHEAHIKAHTASFFYVEPADKQVKYCNGNKRHICNFDYHFTEKKQKYFQIDQNQKYAVFCGHNNGFCKYRKINNEPHFYKPLPKPAPAVEKPLTERQKAESAKWNKFWKNFDVNRPPASPPALEKSLISYEDSSFVLRVQFANTMRFIANELIEKDYNELGNNFLKLEKEYRAFLKLKEPSEYKGF